MAKGLPRTLENTTRGPGKKPRKLPSYTVANAPAAASWGGSLIYVTNGAAGSPMVAFSNGTNWLRVDTATAISAT